MSYQFVSYLRELDLSVFHAVNGFCGQNPKLDQFIIRTDFSSLKGLFFVSTFGALWFQRADDQARRRQTLIIMVIAIFVSIIAARAAAILLPFRIRPMFVSDIGFHAPLFSVGNYEDWSSFPSDTATYYFVITTGFWFLSRWWGFFLGLFQHHRDTGARLSRHTLSKRRACWGVTRYLHYCCDEQ
jgi:membrane-associated phospholipid phosphatase